MTLLTTLRALPDGTGAFGGPLPPASPPGALLLWVVIGVSLLSALLAVVSFARCVRRRTPVPANVLGLGLMQVVVLAALCVLAPLSYNLDGRAQVLGAAVGLSIAVIVVSAVLAVSKVGWQRADPPRDRDAASELSTATSTDPATPFEAGR
ncbi:MAG: hypothetical protein DI630_29020 [Gordonia sp. (in: high G+C Gram-positive bacteria)]|nr:MAG: hypothetical protein DI630_29020 [Gordonia sp. (in: high G+C Gram-positive bacteria)]